MMTPKEQVRALIRKEAAIPGKGQLKAFMKWLNQSRAGKDVAGWGSSRLGKWLGKSKGGRFYKLLRRNPIKSLAIGLPAGAYGYKKALDYAEGPDQLKTVPAADQELREMKEKVTKKRKEQGKEKREKLNIPDEVIAGVGGAAVGAPAGYYLAPKLGIDRVTGTLGAGAAAAVLAAIAANRFGKKK
jgi:hypothetical protein